MKHSQHQVHINTPRAIKASVCVAVCVLQVGLRRGSGMRRCRPQLCCMGSLSKSSSSRGSLLAKNGLNFRNQQLGLPAGRPLQQPSHLTCRPSQHIWSPVPRMCSHPAAPPVSAHSSEERRVHLTFANKVTKTLGVTERILHHSPPSPHALQTAAAPHRPASCRRSGRAVISYQGIAGAR